MMERSMQQERDRLYDEAIAALRRAAADDKLEKLEKITQMKQILIRLERDLWRLDFIEEVSKEWSDSAS